ncbi:amino acid transporter [Ameyamaea chiangmaiensis NBRC 103196]|uniref:APC family permease n=1 Tax=Ameyamaea chiangmaiensis TaxID=442969 RepID=A0A850P9K6_9PROT|nr:APC family permease [Ameyamaea chiangmaiensis]MBS4073970.1 APC family permease [Ameyamaea chiangmaiensis]NVN40714.1 APC family permease [Ameyamaea chiangmaiensis]GBQ67763.1 amino acid transporter [Ameyamaea chiangmaiensis NBRC 103196]
MNVLPPSPPQLKQGMTMIGTTLITLSAISPASSALIIAPSAIAAAGSGSVLAMIGGALVGLCMALVYAELASAFPLTGGEYAIVGRVLGPLTGFIVLGVNLVGLILIPAIMALGLSAYLGVVFPALPQIPTAIAAVIISTGLGILNIRTSALITGLFLGVEVAALVLLTVLGLWHVVHPLSELITHPVMLNASHALVPTPPSTIAMAMSVAIFAYNGYGTAVYLGEETVDAARHIARSILAALVAAVLAELVPVTAVLMGVPDYRSFLSSSDMFSDFITLRAGAVWTTVVSIAVALAIVNAVIANLLLASRQMFSMARDHVLPGTLNAPLARLHARYHSPWVAMIAAGAMTCVACFVSLHLLVIATGTGLILVYSMLCVAVITGRKRGLTAHGHYAMPLFPLAPVAALAAMGYVVFSNWLAPDVGRPSLIFTLCVAVASGLYYATVLARRGGWVLRGPGPEM